MPIRNPNEKLHRAQAFLENTQVLNLHAQAHARCILRHLSAPISEWPNFRGDLDERLHHAAHYLLWTALELLEAGQSEHDVRPLFLAGAEALEFLSIDPRYDSSVRIEQVVNATFGYYLAGHYARSYLLLREAIPDSVELPPALSLLVTVLRKKLGDARKITVAHFFDPALQDDLITEELTEGEIGEDEAYDRMLLASATQAVSYFLEFPKSGDHGFLEDALGVLDDAIIVAREKRYVDWWWWLYCLRFLFREFGEASPWTKLGPLGGDEGGRALVEEYIRAGIRCDPPILELWPSQMHAVPVITDESRGDFCLKMPTSSGKTRIAELTILQFLLDTPTDPDARCIYIAPFRSLAAEIEQTLRRSFGTLGVMVSQIYGGFEITPDEIEALREYRVLVATPEKLDALLRYAPELEPDIRLVIIDEGHIVDPNIRGLRFEVFVHRLLRRLDRDRCRFVFISAVLPNAREFAEWITGTREKLVESSWRPSRLMLGRLTWDGGVARIDYTHEGRNRFSQECYVPRFIEQRECRKIPGMGRRRNPFPHQTKEAYALAALLFAQEGTTLVFIPRKKDAEPFGRDLLEALRMHRTLKEHEGESFSLPTPKQESTVWKRCKRIIGSEVGEDSLLLQLLDEGILVHHGKLPARVRVAMEELVRTHPLRLIVSTTTLAQGVNLPIKTVLVRGLSYGHGDTVNPLTFWNICGRAGRALRENEGQILFCIDKTAPMERRRRLEQGIRRVVDTLEQTQVVSALRRWLQAIVHIWRRSHPTVELSELCMYLAENRLDWATGEDEEAVEGLLDTLDGHVLALSEEFNLDPADPATIQAVLQGSLLYIQLRDDPDAILTSEESGEIVRARVRHLHRAHPEPSTRQRMYKLGMSLSACEAVEEEKAELLEMFLEAEQWEEWTPEQRYDLLIRISRFILSLPDTSPEEAVPDDWPVILAAWLSGTRTTEMVEDRRIAKFMDSPSELAHYLEEVCGYLLAWGMNSILTFLSMLAAESGREMPSICSYFAGMLKYGVGDAVAVCIMPHVDQERKLAIEAATVCPHGFDHPKRIIRWIRSVSEQELIDSGLEPSVAEAIIERRDWRKQSIAAKRKRQSDSSRIPVSQEVYDSIEIGERLLIVPTEGQDHEGERVRFTVLTLDGRKIGRFKRKSVIPGWWFELDLVETEVINKEETEDGFLLLLGIVET